MLKTQHQVWSPNTSPSSPGREVEVMALLPVVEFAPVSVTHHSASALMNLQASLSPATGTNNIKLQLSQSDNKAAFRQLAILSLLVFNGISISVLHWRRLLAC